MLGEIKNGFYSVHIGFLRDCPWNGGSTSAKRSESWLSYSKDLSECSSTSVILSCEIATKERVQFPRLFVIYFG